MSTDAPPLLVRIYAGATGLVVPLAYRRVTAKLNLQGIDPKRFSERIGHASIPRPNGRLMWFHAASVGESLSVLRLIAHLGDVHPHLSFLITSGTATSAQILAKRLPPRCQHQFAPLDGRRAVLRFLDHWRPDAAVFVESELWPNMLRETASRGVPLALLNARISDRSAQNWHRFPQVARFLLNHFQWIHTQDARTTAHFEALGITQAETGQNLKSASGALPYDPEARRSFENAVTARPLWVASSTHPGEEEIMLDAHAQLLKDNPDLLLILVPRHPDRAPDIQRLIAAAELTSAQRSAGDPPTPQTQVYLADTMGETGLWYALSPIVCLGGSFTPVGGHNPYEPAYAGAAVLHGPLYANFSDAYADFAQAGGACEVTDATELADQITHLLAAPSDLSALRDQARAFATTQDDMLGALSDTLSQVLSLR